MRKSNVKPLVTVKRKEVTSVPPPLVTFGIERSPERFDRFRVVRAQISRETPPKVKLEPVSQWEPSRYALDRLAVATERLFESDQRSYRQVGERGGK